LEDVPVVIEEKLKSGLAALQRGQISLAVAAFTDILSIQPKHSGALQLLGMARKSEGSVHEACNLLRQSLDVHPNQPHVLNNLANMLGEFEPNEAIKCYQRAIQFKPDYYEAISNLAGVRLSQYDYDQARTDFERALIIAPGHVQSLLGLASLSHLMSEFTRGEAFARQALELAPGSSRGHQLLGDLLSGQGRYEEAIIVYRQALAIGPPSAGLWAALGGALRYCLLDQEAFSAFSSALQLDPAHVGAHRNLNALLWSYGRTEKYLDSYRTMLPLVPRAADVRCAFVDDLIRLGDCNGAQDVVREIGTIAPNHLELAKLQGRICMSQGDTAGAIDWFTRACEQRPALAELWTLRLDALLKHHKFQAAYELAIEVAARFPLDQDVLARLLAGAKLSGNLAASGLWSPQTLVRTFDLIPPHGQTIDDFNELLGAHLASLHITKNHPLDQTLRGGTQTFGNLFSLDKSPIVQKLTGMLRQAIGSYLDDLPKGLLHPVARRPEQNSFEFAGSWSARLFKDGFHTNHIHPQGWISSAYYVALPGQTADHHKKPGWLKFGQTNMALGREDVPLMHIEPRVGRLVLFPSFYWHGTTPFDDEGERLTVAFDVVPKS
jgi:tetratricopeptide (TPR) repeat protein